MKKCFTAVVCIMLVSFCVFSTRGIDIDGENDGAEWNSSEFYILFNSSEQSKCDVEYADIRVILENDNTVSVLFQAIDSSFNEEKSAVRLGVNGKSFTLAVNGRSKYSNAEYSVKFNTPNYNNDYVIEAKLLFAEVVEESVEMSVIVIDGNGISSTKRTVKIYPKYQQLEPKTTKKPPKTTVPKTTKPKTTKPPKTTSPKSTKPKSTVPVSPNKSKTPSRKSFWNIGSGNEYNDTEDEENFVPEQQSDAELSQFDLSSGNIQNHQKYKILVIILICLLLFSAALIMVIPVLRKNIKNDSQSENKNDNDK